MEIKRKYQCPQCKGSICRLGKREKPFLCRQCDTWYSEDEVRVKPTNEELQNECTECREATNKAIDLMKQAFSKKIPKWINVKEYLPEEMNVVQITDGINVGHGFYYNGNWHTPFSDIDENHVIYWMTFPEIPKEINKNE